MILNINPTHPNHAICVFSVLR